ncbi:DNA repair and recombination protein pif1, mitochondrial, partial [Trachymyrmex cornetzi]
IHLRLFEIYDTTDCDDGWFGQKHILLFGDLLQLSPVHEDSAFIQLIAENIRKYLGSLSATNLWTLFDYDELTINMRQQGDGSYRELLSRIRVGLLTPSDYDVLELETTLLCADVARRSRAAARVAKSRITSKEILLIAEDTIDCISYMKKKVTKVLSNDDDDDDDTRTAGLSKRITIKIGAKVMIRRNIDASLGLVNGLSLQNAIMDLGNNVFSCGQTYVALSRVTSLDGLHLINFDPSSVFASEKAILEYNRLKQIHNSESEMITISKQRYRKVKDVSWTLSKVITSVQESGQKKVPLKNTAWVICGFQNIDKISCYANAVLQCLLNLYTLLNKIKESLVSPCKNRKISR